MKKCVKVGDFGVKSEGRGYILPKMLLKNDQRLSQSAVKILVKKVFLISDF